MEYVADYSVDDVSTFSLVNAIPRQYRFIDIQRLKDHGRLSIISTSKLPSKPYAAVSHVWRVLNPITSKNETFEVEGTEKHSRIPKEILRVICHAASNLGCSLLWLDKLCIRQDSATVEDGKKDNEWQVEHMFGIYQSCAACLVLPGGLGQLTTLEDKTFWLERSWTLQESLAPSKVKIVFRWTKGDAVLQSNFPVFIEEVVQGEVAVADLKGLLQISLKSNVRMMQRDLNPEFEECPVQDLAIFGGRKSHNESGIMALLGALEHTNETGRLNAIWRCTILRSAKYPQDMIYSIMGLMDITLDVSYDKSPATVAVELTSRLIANGCAADWLGIAPRLGPNIDHSAMPILPKANNEGAASVEIARGSWIQVKEVLGGILDMWWWLKDAPRGTVDSRGFLTFTGFATPVIREDSDGVNLEGTSQVDHPDNIVQCSDNQVWKLLRPGQTMSDHYAVIIGHREEYRSGIFSAYVVPDSTLLMILKSSQSGTCQNVGYAWARSNIGEDWALQEFKVGG